MEQYLPFALAGAILVVLLLVLLLARSRGRGRGIEARPEERAGPQRTEAARVEAPPRETPSPPTPAEPLAAKAPPAAPPSRLARGLAKSRRQLAERLAALSGKAELDQEAWDEVEEALISADVGVEPTVGIVERLRRAAPGAGDLREHLSRELVSILDSGERSFLFSTTAPSVWLVTGVNGTGKTTSIAKLAHLLSSQGKTVVLAAADTFRAAAIDQLGTWAKRLGVHMVKHAPGADPGAVVFDAIEHARARSVDVVIVDTAGRLHTKTNLMEELKKIRRVADRQGDHVSEVLLVVDATVGQNGISQAATFKEAIDVTGVVLTKLDGTARGGIVVAIQELLGIPVKAVGVGESVEDLEPFNPATFVAALLEE